MAVKLIGTDTAGDTAASYGYVFSNQFTCDVTGVLSSVKVHCLFTNTNVRVAIYSDNGSNQVNVLLQESASTAITTGDWRSVDLAASVNVTSGTKYWLAVQAQTNVAIAYRLVTCVRSYKAQSYGAFPADGTGFSYDTVAEVPLQGWGTAVAAYSKSASIKILLDLTKKIGIEKAVQKVQYELISSIKIGLSKAAIKLNVDLISSEISRLIQIIRKIPSIIRLSLLSEFIIEFVLKLMSTIRLISALSQKIEIFREVQNVLDLITLFRRKISLAPIKLQIQLLQVISKLSRFNRKLSEIINLSLMSDIFAEFVRILSIQLKLTLKIIKKIVLNKKISSSLILLSNIGRVFLLGRILKLKELLVTTFEYLHTTPIIEKILSAIVKLSSKVRYGLVRILLNSIALSLITEKITGFVKGLILKIDLETNIVRKIVLKRIQTVVINLISEIKKVLEVKFIFENSIKLVTKFIKGFSKIPFSIFLILKVVKTKISGKRITFKSIITLISIIERTILINRKFISIISLNFISDFFGKYSKLLSERIILLSKKKFSLRKTFKIIINLVIVRIPLRRVFSLIASLVSSSSRNIFINRRFSNIILLSLISEKLIKFIQNLIVRINLASKISRKALFRRIQILMIDLISIIRRITKIKLVFKNSINLIPTMSEIIKYLRKFSSQIEEIISKTLITIGRSFRNIVINVSKLSRQINIRRKLISIELLSIFSEKLISFIQMFISSIAIKVSVKRMIEIFRVVLVSELLILTIAFQRRIIRIFLITEKLYSILNRRIQIRLELFSIQFLKPILKRIIGFRKILNNTVNLIPTISKLEKYIRRLSVQIKEISIIWYYTKVLGYKVIKFIREDYIIKYIRDRFNVKFWRRD